MSLNKTELKLKQTLVNLANASAILYSHTKDIGKYEGGSGESARGLVKMELEEANRLLNELNK